MAGVENGANSASAWRAAGAALPAPPPETRLDGHRRGPLFSWIGGVAPFGGNTSAPPFRNPGRMMEHPLWMDKNPYHHLSIGANVAGV